MALQIEVKSNSRQARSDLSKLNKSVDQIATTTANMANKLQKSVAILSTGIAGLVAGKALTNVTDSYRRLEARIALTNKSVEAQAHAFKEINKIALETRCNQESLADLYSRIGRATKVLGVEQAEVIKVTRSIAQAITISGSSAESANSAIVQLGQGLAAGALRGQELNSVMEQTPAVAQAIARGMGITIGQLRAFANEGKLSAQAVVDALSGQSEAIDEEFARIPVTFDQAFLVMTTGLGRIVNEVDQVFGFTEALSDSLLRMGRSMNAQAEPIADFLRSISKTSIVGKEIGDIFTALGTLGGSILNALGAAFDRLIPLDLLIRIEQLKNFLLVELLKGTGEIIRFLINIDTMIIRFASSIDVLTARYERSFLSKGFRAGAVGLVSFIGDLQAAVALIEASIIILGAQIVQGVDKFAISVNRIVGIVVASLLRIRDEFENFEGYFDFSLVVRRSISEVKKMDFIVGTVADVLGRVTDSFRKAYIAIIGNSWWTDTVDEVVEKANEFKKALRPINEFLDATVEKFKDSWSMLGKVVRNDSMIFDYRQLWLARLRFELFKFELQTRVILHNMSKDIPRFFNKMGDGVQDGLKPAGGALSRLGDMFNRMVSDMDVGVTLVNTILRGLAVVALAMISPFAAIAFAAINAIGFVVKSTKNGIDGVADSMDTMIAKIRSFTGEFDLIKDGLPALQNLGSKFNFLDGFAVGLQAIAEVVRPIGRILTDTFGTALAAVAFGAISIFALPFKTVAIAAGLIMRQELTTAINAVLGLFGTNLSNVLESLGDMGGRVAASIAKAVPQIIGLLGDITTGFVNGFLDSFGIIGDILRGIFNLINTLTLGLLGSLGGVAGGGILLALILGKGPGKIFAVVTAIMGNIKSLITAGTLTNASGAISTMLFGASGGAGLLGKVKSIMAPIFGYILTGIAGMTSALLKAVPALSGVFSFFSLDNLKKIAAGFTLVNIQTAIANFNFKALAASMLTTMRSVIATTAAIIAQTTALAAMIIRNGIAIASNLGLSLSFTSLTGVFAFVANAARMMWVAISGPFAPFMIALLGLIALFSSAGAAADDVEGDLDSLERKSNNTRNKLANLFGLGVDLKIEANLDPASVEDTFALIEDTNENTLYAMNRQLADSFWFMEWVDDMSTYLSIGFTQAFIDVTNRWKNGANRIVRFLNTTFGSSFQFFQEEDRDAVQKLLDEIDPNLRINLDINAEDLEKFTDADMRGMFTGTVQAIADIKAELEDAEGFFGFLDDDDAIAKLNRQLEVQENRLESVTNAIQRQVRAGTQLEKISNAYDVIANRLKDATSLFDGQAISAKSQLDFVKLTAVEQQEYLDRVGEAQVINGRIQDILATTMITEEARKDLVAEQLALLDETGYQIDQIGVSLERFSDFDLATGLGLDENLIAKLAGTDLGSNVLDKIISKQQEIVDKEREIQELRRTEADLDSIGKAQAELLQLERDGETLVDGAERSLLSMFDKLTADLANSDLSLSSSEFLDLGADLQTEVLDYADKLKVLNDRIAEAVGDPAALKQIEIDKKALSDSIGQALAIDVDFALLDNFAKVVKPFSDVGLSFDTDTITRLGQDYGKKTLEQASTLAAERLRIQNTNYSLLKNGDEQRLADVFQYNRDYNDLEKRLREDRADALLNEETSKELGKGFGDSIVKAMSGEANFGESISGLITGKIEQGLSDRIADFAEGFLNSFFDMFEGEDGLLGGLAGALKGPDNEEGRGLKSAGSGLFDSISGGGKGDNEGGDPLKAATGLGAFTEKLKEGASGLGSWASQTLMNIAQFFGLSTATTGATAAVAAQIPAQTAQALAMSAATAAATSLAIALTAAAAASVIPGFSTGGAVNGRGTGTSDSIMARLSNGEYVINAKQTKKHRGLIEAINQGQELPGYATGGIVDLGASSQAVMADVASRPQPSGNQTVQNINITGDISRQTKKEIFGMLPQIAVGVNQQNREQNR